MAISPEAHDRWPPLGVRGPSGGGGASGAPPPFGFASALRLCSNESVLRCSQPFSLSFSLYASLTRTRPLVSSIESGDGCRDGDESRAPSMAPLHRLYQRIRRAAMRKEMELRELNGGTAGDASSKVAENSEDRTKHLLADSLTFSLNREEVSSSYLAVSS